jgi:transcriptional regulator with XRE-family HTH domain
VIASSTPEKIPPTAGRGRLRLRAALSQIELAKRAGVAPAAVNRIERNRVEPQMRTVRKLAKALEVEPHMLIEGP